ncbi:MAG: Asp23/Gls24 family envelope stress response protein [Eubacterium sp.]|nr:Asp23/Gls24 family envelope stress response protein [Eubacterium sp.]
MPQKPIKNTRGAKNTRAAKNAYTIFDEQTVGTVQITDDVIATIAAIAATDVEGVASVGGGITREKAAKIGGRAIAKAVKVEILDNILKVRIIITVTYGSSIPETTRKVQKKVKSTLETMTGLTVEEVRVSVADVALHTK